MEKAKEEWYVSADEVNYSDGPYESREVAIYEGKKEYEFDFWVGKRIHCEFKISSRDILDIIEEKLSEQAYDQVNDHAEGWPEYNRESEIILKAEIDKFLAEFLPKIFELKKPNFFAIAEVEKVENDV